ncbi:MAG TPA: TIR domain-containing protein [Thermoanaerobaculia bacterium]|nr:TIR domain-containing protein [Thermoanaerobaculia bacterium]
MKLIHAIAAHGKRVNSVAFDPNGGMLASSGDDRAVKVWDIGSGGLVGILSHDTMINSVAFDPASRTVAGGSSDGTIKLWEFPDGKLLPSLNKHENTVWSIAFDAQGQTLASGSSDRTARIWNWRNGNARAILTGHLSGIRSVAFGPKNGILASSSEDHTVKIWEPHTGRLLHSLQCGGYALAVAFSPDGATLASASSNDVAIWEPHTGKLLRTLEGHTSYVTSLKFSPDGRLLASKSNHDTIRLWNCETWESVGFIYEQTHNLLAALAFHPTMPLLATGDESGVIRLFELDYNVLLRQNTPAIHHTTAKIVIVGDHSVGKSALAYRLIHGRFETQESTHGQKFWIFPALGKQRADKTECEAILWDFAGQPDYRLVHALFVDNADLALVLFDASDLRDPLHGVGFWLKQLQTAQSRCPIILVAAQTDRGTGPMTQEELETFCKKHNIVGPIETSALTGAGIDALVERMKSLIPWDDKPATVTTLTFKRIKDYVLGLKDKGFIVTVAELRNSLEATDGEILTAVGHLENYGYVKRLRTSKGEMRILLQPERLNNLASSFVLEARRNPKGLGALEEKRLLAGGYAFPELKDLQASDRDVLLDSAALLFLEHNVCFRETDPLRMEPYLVFPELINLKKPPEDESATEDGVAYTVSGPTENVFASLVVLLGYTHTFTRTAQWHNNARYEVGDGLVCGFRQDAERDGELDFVLRFAPNVGRPVRTLFQGLFESFLARRNLTVMRYEPVRCGNGHILDRAVVRQWMKDGKQFVFCNDCGEKLTLPAMAEPIALTREVKAEVDAQRHAAEQRTRFEQAVFSIRAFVSEQKITPPSCFISYAWGAPEQERWVEKRLAADLQKAGIEVVLDRWHNAQIGASVGRFIERIEKIDRILVIGTTRYRQKYENKDASTGYVVAAEVDLIHNRLLGTEPQKQTVLPLLLDGEKTASLPPLLHGRVHADFRDERSYFTTAFDLILSLYQLPVTHSAVADLRESLSESRLPRR